MKYKNNDIHRLVSLFEDTTLPKSEWTHQAHLIVVIYYCKKYNLETTIHLLRINIQKYNNHNGVLNTNKSGYHETITLFWVYVVYNYLIKNTEYP